MATLRYGAHSSVQIDFDACTLLAECDGPRSARPAPLAEAVHDVLAKPVGLPALSRCITPSDQITIALEAGVPEAAEVAAAVVRYLVDSAVDPDGITVLRSAPPAGGEPQNPTAAIPADLLRRIRLVDHDPRDRASLAYLAASHSGEPIWLNRALTDADVVLPIGCAHGRAVPGQFGLHSAIYPTFADYQAQARFRSPQALGARGRHRKGFVDAVAEIGWLLGIAFTVQVIPGAGGAFHQVVAGSPDQVRRRVRAVYDQTWRWDVPRRAGVVVVGIEGGPEQQTWANVARALTAAMDCVRDEGTVIVCCEVAEAPGEAVESLRAARSHQQAVRAMTNKPPDDALTAVQLARAIERVNLFLRSRLDPDMLEDLLIGAIQSDEELNRLVSRFHDGIVLGNAPQTEVRVATK
ncbi:MAG: lactate racemase domain-containing protein [Pirellulales bacterium]|nr:lactate racemase domain-containing protein [Pirellulales bacterium]